MELKYRILGAGHEPTEGLEKNYDAASILMGNFELPGLFSDILLSRVFLLTVTALRNLENCLYDEAKEVYKEFESILNTYCIFSDEFKSECKYQFLILCTAEPAYKMNKAKENETGNNN